MLKHPQTQGIYRRRSEDGKCSPGKDDSDMTGTQERVLLSVLHQVKIIQGGERHFYSPLQSVF